MPSAAHIGRQNGYGRKKGTPNKDTAAIKDMIIGALMDAGGREYLARQALLNPGPFLTLVGKVLPMQIAGDPERPMVIDFRWADATQPTTIEGVVSETRLQHDAHEATQLEVTFETKDTSC